MCVCVRDKVVCLLPKKGANEGSISKMGNPPQLPALHACSLFYPSTAPVPSSVSRTDGLDCYITTEGLSLDSRLTYLCNFSTLSVRLPSHLDLDQTAFSSLSSDRTRHGQIPAKLARRRMSHCRGVSSVVLKLISVLPQTRSRDVSPNRGASVPDVAAISSERETVSDWRKRCKINTTEQIKLVKLAHVRYRHPELDTITRFLRDFGMHTVKKAEDKIWYGGYGSDQYVCRSYHEAIRRSSLRHTLARLCGEGRKGLSGWHLCRRKLRGLGEGYATAWCY